MCAGYELEADVEGLVQAFRVDESQLDVPVPYELYPKLNAPIVLEARGKRLLGLARWGLIPHWADDPAIGRKLFNARAEGIATKPAFRDAFAQRRCLVPVSAFHEWQRDAANKAHRHRVRPSDGPFLALAGLWASWRSPAGEKIGSFTIVTTQPNGLLAPIHDRMPVVLDAAGQARWLAPTENPSALLALLVPCPDAWLALSAG